MGDLPTSTALVGLLADADVRGHFELLLAICRGPHWGDFWASLRLDVFDFSGLRLARDARDSDIWDTCQRRGLILVTGNRNSSDEDSLEATLRASNTAVSLPVFTLSNRDRILSDPDYAERVATRLLELLDNVEMLRGTGRLWLP